MNVLVENKTVMHTQVHGMWQAYIVMLYDIHDGMEIRLTPLPVSSLNHAKMRARNEY